METFPLAVADWQMALGEKQVLLTTDELRTYSPSTNPAFVSSIRAALRPNDLDELAALVKIAARHRIPLYPLSTGRNWGYGTAQPPVSGCVLVDLSRLNRILQFDATSGLVRLEPGVTQIQLHNFLSEQRAPFMVPTTGAGPNCSILANALERGYGITPYTDHFLAVRRLEAILPDGSTYRGALSEWGGAAVDSAFKWGVGPYLDGLFSQGSFGIVTEATVALAPRPETIEAFFFTAQDEKALESLVDCVRDLQTQLSGIVGAVNLMNQRRILAMTIPYPNRQPDDTATLSDELVAALAKPLQIQRWTGVGALYGNKLVIAAAKKVVKQTLRGRVGRLIFFTAARAERAQKIVALLPDRFAHVRRRLATIRTTLDIMAGVPSEVSLPLAYWRSGKTPPVTGLDPGRDGCGVIWYTPLVALNPDNVREYTSFVTEVCNRYGIETLITLTSLSAQCFDSSVPLLFDLRSPQAVANANACYRELFERGCAKGFVPYRVGSEFMSLLTGNGGSSWDLIRRLKSAVDPDNIMAPGRYTHFGK